MLPPAAAPIITSAIPPQKNCQPHSVVVFSYFENILTKPAAIAAESPLMMMSPSPAKVNVKSSPSRFIISTPPNPKTQPKSFIRLNFSVRNIKHAAIMVKNTPSPFKTELFTPVRCARPI